MSSKRDNLEELFFEFENWISCLKDFRKEHEVESRSDYQERQIQLTFAKLAEHLKKAEAKYLVEIFESRQAALDAIFSSSDPGIPSENDKIATEITPFSVEVNALCQNKTVQLDESIERKIDGLLERARDLKRRQRSTAFQSRFLQFNVNPMFQMPGSLPGRTRYFCCEPKHKLFTVTIKKLLSVLRSSFPAPYVDPEDRKLVLEKPAGLKQVCALAVLSDDRVAIASLDGSLKIISLVGDSPGKLLIGPKQRPNHTSFIEVLINDDIVISDCSLERPHLQVWDSATGELVQSIDTEHTGHIVSCHLCPKKEKLVTVSLDGSVRTWLIKIDNICLRSSYNN